VGRVGAIAGPAVTGGLVAAGIAYPWGFYVFAAAGALAVVALVAVPHAIAAKTAAVEHAG
jgi:MFS family permease